MEPASFLLRPDNLVDPLPLHEIFTNPATLELDIGCGKGRFLLARAAQYPGHAFLGIDRSRARLRKVEKKIQRQRAQNIRLLQLEAAYSVRYLLPPASVATVYVFFPDPWPKRRHHDRRLVNQKFLDSLYAVMRPGATLHAATDHLDYFYQIEQLLDADPHYCRCDTFIPTEQEQTDFERLFLAKGASIGRCSFQSLPPERPHRDRR